MNSRIIADKIFDGENYLTDGPYLLETIDGHICSIDNNFTPCTKEQLPHYPFITPSFTEAHCHIFLDGDELDASKRSEYLKSDKDTMVKVAATNVEKYRKNGIKLIRDAGDIHGINAVIKRNLQNDKLEFQTATKGIRKQKRYGSFMAEETTDNESITNAVKEIAKHADVIKIILTGIIDFENGVVKGTPQFTESEAKLMVDTAHELGLKTFAHCSGLEGLQIAVNAGIDSIEHGFFMNEEILSVMKEKNIAWVPTIAPVNFHKDFPQHCGWNEKAVQGLKSILDNHSKMLKKAEEIGITIISGSDAGSYGVKHGKGLIEELKLMHKAGLSTETILKSTTSSPRNEWNLAPNYIKKGNKADIIAFPKSLFEDFESIDSPIVDVI